MSPYIGLARNLLCCLKDFGFFSTPAHLTPLIHLPLFALLSYLPSQLTPILSKTTIIEVPIFFLQSHPIIFLTFPSLLATITLLKSRATLTAWSTLLAAKTASLAADDLPATPTRRRKTPTKKDVTDNDDKDEKRDPYTTAITLQTLHFSLSSYHTQQNIALVSNLCCLIIGPAFFWLSTHSIHLSDTHYFGGLDAVIVALCFMELALCPLLYFMWRDGLRSSYVYTVMTSVADAGWDGDVSCREMCDGDFESFKVLVECVTDATLFRAENCGTANGEMPKKKVRDSHDEMLYDMALEKGFGLSSSENVTLYPWYSEPSSESSGEKLDACYAALYAGVDLLVNNTNDAQPTIVWDALPCIQGGGERLAIERWRVYLYFVLNACAFWGYMMAPVTYYGVAPMLKLGLSDSMADWFGNFLGDFCWALEPAIVLTGDWMITKWLFWGGEDEEEKKGKKVKKD